MARFFVPPECCGEEVIPIRGDDVNHMKNVLRMNVGDEVVVSCGRGTDYFCRIESIEREEVLLRVVEERPVKTELPGKIVLFQSLPKKDKMEFIIQKAVELGAVRIVPVISKRCVVKLDQKKEEKKRLRWQTIAEAAAKQSGRGMIPVVHSALSMEDAVAYAKSLETILIPYELSDNMAETVGRMKEAAQGESIGVFIGPEGGFERSEVALVKEAGGHPISLGSRILRTETAGLTVLSVLMFLMEGKE